MALQFVYLLAVMKMKYYEPNDSGHVNMHISGYEDTTVKYLLPWESSYRQVALNSQNDRRFEMTMLLSRVQEDACVSNPIRVTSSNQVNIQVVRGKHNQTNMAAYTALHLLDDSTEFVLSSQRYSEKGLEGSQAIFILAAGMEAAKVEIHNKTAASSLLFTRELSPYEMIEVPSGMADITGLVVQSDRPIAVYSGHQCGNVPVTIGFCEPLLQQIPPVSLVGDLYVIGPILQREMYTARIILTELGSDVILATNDARLFISHSNVRGCILNKISSDDIFNVQCSTPLSMGDYIELRVQPSTASLVVKCSKPCYVYQLNHGGMDPAVEVHTDPFMALVPTLRQHISEVKFSTISTYFRGAVVHMKNYISVIAPVDERVSLDGVELRKGSTGLYGYHSSQVGDYTVHYMEIGHGSHEVRTADGGATSLVVQVYGHGPADGVFSGHTAYGLAGSYAGPAKENLEKDSLTSPTVTTTTITKPVTTVTQTVKSSPTGVTTSIIGVDDSTTHQNTASPGKSILLLFSNSAFSTGVLAAIIVASSIVVITAMSVIIALAIRRKHSNSVNQKMMISQTSSHSTSATFVEVEEDPIKDVNIANLVSGEYCELQKNDRVSSGYEDIEELEYQNSCKDAHANTCVYTDLVSSDEDASYENFVPKVKVTGEA